MSSFLRIPVRDFGIGVPRNGKEIKFLVKGVFLPGNSPLSDEDIGKWLAGFLSRHESTMAQETLRQQQKFTLTASDGRVGQIHTDRVWIKPL